VKLELIHQIASMGFCRFDGHVQECSHLLGCFTLTQELYDLAFSWGQSGYLRPPWTSSMPLQKTIHNQIGNAGGESGLVPFQSFHCYREIIRSVGLENPPTNTRFQTVSDHILGIHVGEYQYPLGWIVLQNLPSCIDAI